MTSWRPISTAPRDRMILIGDFQEGVLIRGIIASWHSTNRYPDDVFISLTGIRIANCTHWTDIPTIIEEE